MSFDGKLLQTLRKEKGLTQKAIAKKLNCSVTNYQQWENGKRTPKPETLIKLAKAMDLPPGYFVQADINQRMIEARIMTDEQADEAKRILFDIHMSGAYPSDLEPEPPRRPVYEEINLKRMSDLMESLNNDGQRKAITYTEDLAKIPEYQKKGQKNNRPDQNDQNGHF